MNFYPPESLKRACIQEENPKVKLPVLVLSKALRNLHGGSTNRDTSYQLPLHTLNTHTQKKIAKLAHAQHLCKHMHILGH